MSAREVAIAIVAAGWLFFRLRDLLVHGWRAKLALRLIVGTSMLSAALGGFVLVLVGHPFLGLILFILAFLIGYVGVKAIQAPGPPATGSPRDAAVQAALATTVFVLTASALFD